MKLFGTRIRSLREVLLGPPGPVETAERLIRDRITVAEVADIVRRHPGLKLEIGMEDWHSREAFREVLARADQRLDSKGTQKHGWGNDLADDDVWRTVGAAGIGFPIGQAIKKASEFMRGQDVTELYDAIAYLAFAAQEHLAQTDGVDAQSVGPSGGREEEQNAGDPEGGQSP